MLRTIKDLHGSTIHARDAEVGKLKEIFFDDEHWTVRYLIVETGNWLNGRKVLISPLAFVSADLDNKNITLNLTRDQIENSPGVETDKPVSRQWESDYYTYYRWPYYWGGMGTWGSTWYPGAMLTLPFNNASMKRPDNFASAVDHLDTHLHSSEAVTGYAISATDGHLGHVQDFVIDDETWQISYLAIDTRDWWPGKKVLLPPTWIKYVNWPEKVVSIDLDREQVKNAPEWEPDEPISREFEVKLYVYYSNLKKPAEAENERLPVGR